LENKIELNAMGPSRLYALRVHRASRLPLTATHNSLAAEASTVIRPLQGTSPMSTRPTDNYRIERFPSRMRWL